MSGIIQRLFFSHRHCESSPRRYSADGASRFAIFFGLLFLCLPIIVSADKTDHLWSLRSLTRTEPPAEGNPVDAFIQAKLTEAGAKQNVPAEPLVLLRRISLDLTGLPPTRQEIASFLANGSKIDSAIDRLLASPHYGERWGRHWLDIARYVQGTIKVPGVAAIDLAEPYRDYVVRSFNEDKPYDRFITEQLAGDLITAKDESEKVRLDRMVAPAFLSIGHWFEECTDPEKLRTDLVDEQISTTTRALLAMNFSCARCHQFDPISMRDYYALAGVFRSTVITSHFADEWRDGRPRALQPLASVEEITRVEAANTKIETLRKERFHLLSTEREKLQPVAVTALPGTVIDVQAENFDGQKDLKTIPLEGGGEALASRRRLDQWVRYRFVLPEAGTYSLAVRYAATDPAPVEMEIEGKVSEHRVLGDATHGETVEHFRWDAIPLGERPAGRMFLRFKVGRNEPFPTLDRLVLVRGSLDPKNSLWREQLDAPTVGGMRDFLTGSQLGIVQSIETRIEELRKSRPVLPLALAVSDAETPTEVPPNPGGISDTSGLKPVPRGNPGLAGEALTHAFPIPKNASGRLQFAEWLTDTKNPLTARVMVNRIWHWHFGRGLVSTVDDFGLRGQTPSHPELLDWLASELIKNGWSIKHIQRLILSSATYQASSEITPESKAKDADGHLYSRFPARRLEVETIYDSMLTSIGKVPRQPSGTILDTSKSKDRALYILTSSRAPLGLGIEIRKMFPLFGFDPSGLPMHDRDASVTPAQGLWWWNNPLPRYYATKLAEKMIAEFPDKLDARTVALHETLLGRPPADKAKAAMLSYADDLIKRNGLSEIDAWSRVALGLFSSVEFRTLE